MSLDAIFSRRSIRKYTAEPVGDDEIEQVLRAAMAAPSAGNQQPWQFVVIRDREILDAVPKFHPYAKMITEAPVAVLVCGDLSKESVKGYWEQDCSAATENLLLAVEALGLGAVWLGVHPETEREEGCRKLMGIPESVVPFALVPIGHPGEQKPPSDRYDPARVHHDRW